MSDSLQKLRELATSKGREPFVWQSGGVGGENEVATVQGLEQRYVLTPSDAKDAYLAQVIRQNYDNEDKKTDILFQN